VVDALRQIALAERVAGADPGSVKFHRLFLFLVERLGRMNEAGLLGAHKLWTGNLFSDLGSGVQMIVKGKIPLVPHIAKGRAQLRTLFRERESGVTRPADDAADARATGA
jgi:hypothetical protein